MNVLCMPAGEEQCCAIEKAKKLGLKVIALDNNADAIGLKRADIGIRQDINNVEEVIEIAKKFNVKAVLPVPIGKQLKVVGAVNSELNLKGISFDGANNCVDKVKCGEILTKNSLSCVRQISCRTYEEIKEAVDSIGYPCIIKPRVGSGSRGVTAVRSDMEFESVISKHIEFRGDDKTVVEEFIVGDEYGIDGIVKEGQFHLMFTRGKEMTELPYRQEVTYFSQVSLEEKTINGIKDLLSKTCRLLKLDNCLIHADIIVCKETEQPHLVEIAGRPSGHNMSNFLLYEATGIDIIEMGIRLSLGENIDIPYDYEVKPFVYKFLDLGVGYVEAIPRHEIFLDNNVIDYEMNIKIGDYLGRVTKGSDIINRGFIAVSGNSLAEAMSTSENILSKFKIRKEF